MYGNEKITPEFIQFLRGSLEQYAAKSQMKSETQALPQSGNQQNDSQAA